MRRLGAIGALASAWGRVGLVSLAIAPALAHPVMAEGEQMLLPFQCSIDRGRVVLTPSADKSYRVVGPRASHAFTACAPADPNRCRTWQIHKFEVACAGQRVPWLAIASALLERAPSKGKIENGRLRLRLGPEWQRQEAIPRGFRHPFGTPEQMLAFPPGFAPSLGSGMRFAGASSPPPTVIDAKPEPRPELKADGKPRLEPKPEPQAVAPAEPRGQDARGAERVAVSGGWTATVVPAPKAEPEITSYVARAFGGAGVVLAAWLGLLFARRRVAPAKTADATTSQTGAGTSRGGATTDAAAECAELVARAVNLHQAARDAVIVLPNVNLREILAGDLAVIQRRLLAADLTEDVADERWERVKPAISGALADLERIARIIAGVLSSQPEQVPAAAVLVAVAVIPETADQAYEVLGVNAAASRTVVKKVVDGLRQSWHPDHAHDAEDRARREDRMKQINTAWDLIKSTGERPALEAEHAA